MHKRCLILLLFAIAPFIGVTAVSADEMWYESMENTTVVTAAAPKAQAAQSIASSSIKKQLASGLGAHKNSDAGASEKEASEEALLFRSVIKGPAPGFGDPSAYLSVDDMHFTTGMTETLPAGTSEGGNMLPPGGG